jgi:intracellular septation protein A
MSETQRGLVVGLLPLLLFYGAEAVADTPTALAVTLVYTVAELAWTWRRDRRIERTTLYMSALVLGLGGLSLASDDPRFMYAMPVIGDAALALVLLVSVGRGQPLLRVLAEKQQPALNDDPHVRRFLGGMTLRLGLNFILHGLACLWAAGVSHETWLFVSGLGQWLFFGAQMVLEAVLARRLPAPD